MAVHGGVVISTPIVIAVNGSECVDVAVCMVPFSWELIQITNEIGLRRFKLRILHLLHQLLIDFIIFNG